MYFPISRYRRAEAVAAAHTNIKDRHFPSEYYSTVFHADARRVRTALKARQLTDARQDTMSDILSAIGTIRVRVRVRVTGH